MIRSGFAAIAALMFLASLIVRPGIAQEPRSEIAAAIDRSPVDILLIDQEQKLLSLNETSGSLSLIDLATGKVLDEIAIGEHPTAMAAFPDSNRVALTTTFSGELVTVLIEGERLRVEQRIKVGFEPYGVAVAPSGKEVYVSCVATHEVAVIDLNAPEDTNHSNNQVVARIATERWPRQLALSQDGGRLAVSTSGDRGMTVIDVAKRKADFSQRFMGLNIGCLAISGDGKEVYFPWIVYRHNPITEGNIKLGWVLASRLSKLKLDGSSRRDALSLDPPGKAVSDPHGIALTPKEDLILVTASGTHELLVFRNDNLPWKDVGGPDHMDRGLREDESRFWRIPLGGRPMGVRVSADGKLAYIANYLANEIQCVDLNAKKIVRSISLGSAASVSPARRGAAIFYDAARSLDQWYSCHSCHYNGTINSEPMDTFNDGSGFTFKTVLSLENLAKTPPYTWHGWQADARAAMRKSLVETMHGDEPSEADVDDLLAFLEALPTPPNPFRLADGGLTEAARRGKQVFEGEKANCISCHNGEYFTDGQIHDVGTGKKNDRYQGYNTPSLRGVYRRVRLLHEGNANSLEELLKGPHAPEKVAGSGELTEDERRDLIEYLKTL
jgi:YVTN family beta-propeller protein